MALMKNNFAITLELDIKLTYKVNRDKATHELGIDLVNIFNTKNILGYSYAPTNSNNNNGVVENYQLGFLPIFYYRIEF